MDSQGQSSINPIIIEEDCDDMLSNMKEAPSMLSYMKVAQLPTHIQRSNSSHEVLPFLSYFQNVGVKRQSTPFDHLPELKKPKILNEVKLDAKKELKGKTVNTSLRQPQVDVRVKHPPQVNVMITNPPKLTTSNIGYKELDSLTKWREDASMILPQNILVKTPKNRRRENMVPVQIYEPCSWDEFMDKVNKKAGHKRTRVQKTLQDRIEEENMGIGNKVAKHILAIQQAQIAIYGDLIDPAQFTRWD